MKGKKKNGHTQISSPGAERSQVVLNCLCSTPPRGSGGLPCFCLLQGTGMESVHLVECSHDLPLPGGCCVLVLCRDPTGRAILQPCWGSRFMTQQTEPSPRLSDLTISWLQCLGFLLVQASLFFLFLWEYWEPSSTSLPSTLAPALSHLRFALLHHWASQAGKYLTEADFKGSKFVLQGCITFLQPAYKSSLPGLFIRWYILPISLFYTLPCKKWSLFSLWNSSHFFLYISGWIHWLQYDLIVI